MPYLEFGKFIWENTNRIKSKMLLKLIWELKCIWSLSSSSAAAAAAAVATATSQWGACAVEECGTSSLHVSRRRTRCDRHTNVIHPSGQPAYTTTEGRILHPIGNQYPIYDGGAPSAWMHSHLFTRHLYNAAAGGCSRRTTETDTSRYTESWAKI